MKRSLWSIVIAVAVYTGIVLYSDAGSVGRAISRISPVWIPLFLSLSMANYLLRFLKWQYFLRRVGVRIGAWESLRIFLAGFSMTVSPGKLGELLKCHLLKERRGIPVSTTSPVVIAERITDLISMIIIAVIGLLMVRHPGAVVAVAAGIVFVAAVMTLLLWERAFGLLVRLLCRIPRLGQHREGFSRFRDHCSALLDLRSLAVSVPLGVLSWGAEALVLCLVARSMGLALPVGLALLAHSAGTIAGAVSMVPGGLGLTEITIGATLTLAMPEADAAAVTLVMRFATLWFAVLLGVVVLMLLRDGRKGVRSPG